MQVSDPNLMCLNMNGSDIFRYSNKSLKYGEGISLDKEGNIYCCGYCSGNIHQVTPDGKLIKLVITNIKGPTFIET